MKLVHTKNHLYPDLSGFCQERVVDTSPDLHRPVPSRLTPTAPPLSDTDSLLCESQSSEIPEEPEVDYVEYEPDYDEISEETFNNLNVHVCQEKVLLDKDISGLAPPRASSDIEQWLTWRTQSNKLLVSVILSRKGHETAYPPAPDIRRIPLSQENIDHIVEDAHTGRHRCSWDRTARTSLPESPYIMYGIPRVRHVR